MGAEELPFFSSLIEILQQSTQDMLRFCIAGPEQSITASISECWRHSNWVWRPQLFWFQNTSKFMDGPLDLLFLYMFSNLTFYSGSNVCGFRFLSRSSLSHCQLIHFCAILLTSPRLRQEQSDHVCAIIHFYVYSIQMRTAFEQCLLLKRCLWVSTGPSVF